MPERFTDALACVCFVGAPVEADSEIAAASETTPTAAAPRGPLDFPEFGFSTGLGRLAQLATIAEWTFRAA